MISIKLANIDIELGVSKYQPPPFEEAKGSQLDAGCAVESVLKT